MLPYINLMCQRLEGFVAQHYMIGPEFEQNLMLTQSVTQMAKDVVQSIESRIGKETSPKLVAPLLIMTVSHVMANNRVDAQAGIDKVIDTLQEHSKHAHSMMDMITCSCTIAFAFGLSRLDGLLDMVQMVLDMIKELDSIGVLF